MIITIKENNIIEVKRNKRKGIWLKWERTGKAGGSRCKDCCLECFDLCSNVFYPRGLLCDTISQALGMIDFIYFEKLKLIR